MITSIIRIIKNKEKLGKYRTTIGYANDMFFKAIHVSEIAYCISTHHSKMQRAGSDQSFLNLIS